MKCALISAFAFLLSATAAHATEPCRLIHGRAKVYTGDSNFRLWHIGTNHEFDLVNDDSSWKLMDRYLKAPDGMPTNVVFGDFLVCPFEPYKEGAAQAATVKSVRHPVVVSEDDWEAHYAPKR